MHPHSLGPGNCPKAGPSTVLLLRCVGNCHIAGNNASNRRQNPDVGYVNQALQDTMFPPPIQNLAVNQYRQHSCSPISASASIVSPAATTSQCLLTSSSASPVNATLSEIPLSSVSRHDTDREFGNAYTDGGEAQKITWATVQVVVTNFDDNKTGLCATLSEGDKAALKVENWNYFNPLAKELNSIIKKICSRYATYKEFEDSNFQGIDVVISNVSTILKILKSLNIELIQIDFDSDMITHNVKEYFKKCMDALNIDYAGRMDKFETYKAQRKFSLLHLVLDVVFFNNATKSAAWTIHLLLDLPMH